MAEKETPDGTILIAHLADTHLRDTQYVTVRRGEDFFDAAKQAVTKSAAKADILVLVGDIFDRPRPSPRVIGQLMHLDKIAREAGKIILSVTGNHDWCKPTWLDTLFPGRLPESGELDESHSGIIPIDGRSASFRGFLFAGVLPHSHVAFRNHLAETTVLARKADVVLYHGLVTGVVPMYGGLKDPLRVEELPISKNNKAWLLGDIHKQGYIDLDRPGGGNVLTGYPGSTEMCSASEDIDKSIPLIRVSKTKAEVEGDIPLETRPFISAEVRTEEDLEDLMKKVTPVADEHPVVVVKFSRDIPQTVNRLHSVLDAQRAVVKCHTLPSEKFSNKREQDDQGETRFPIDHFISKRFPDDEALQTVALDLLHRGDKDADSIVHGFVEDRIEASQIREEEE